MRFASRISRTFTAFTHMSAQHHTISIMKSSMHVQGRPLQGSLTGERHSRSRFCAAIVNGGVWVLMSCEGF